MKAKIKQDRVNTATYRFRNLDNQKFKTVEESQKFIKPVLPSKINVKTVYSTSPNPEQQPLNHRVK